MDTLWKGLEILPKPQMAIGSGSRAWPPCKEPSLGLDEPSLGSCDIIIGAMVKIVNLGLPIGKYHSQY